MSYWFVYWFTRLGWLHFAVGLFAWLSILIFVFLLLIMIINLCKERENDELVGRLKKPLKLSLVVMLVVLFFDFITPSMKQAAAIYLLPKIVSSDAVKEAEIMPTNLAKLLNGKMKEWLNDITSEQTKQIKEAP